MPLYLYENPETGEVKEIFQGMNEKHQYSENGVEWERVFLAPNAFVKDSPVDPDNPNSFMRVTDGKKGAIGDLMDRSAELSEKRKERYGEDPVKKAADEKWSRERKGRKLPKKLKDLHIKI